MFLKVKPKSIKDPVTATHIVPLRRLDICQESTLRLPSILKLLWEQWPSSLAKNTLKTYLKIRNAVIFKRAIKGAIKDHLRAVRLTGIQHQIVETRLFCTSDSRTHPTSTHILSTCWTESLPWWQNSELGGLWSLWVYQQVAGLILSQYGCWI